MLSKAKYLAFIESCYAGWAQQAQKQALSVCKKPSKQPDCAQMRNIGY